MILTGSQIVIEVLKEEGVDTVFGYPGGTILNIYDELYRHRQEIRHILTSHEQGASHAADGYARATGKTGVCFATSGPGSTNLVTGIATAYMDSVPLVAVTCNVNLTSLGKDSFQEVDMTGVTMPVTKHGYIVKDVKTLASTLRKAFRIARSGRPGPVVVDMTKDVTSAKCEFSGKTPEEPEAVRKYTDEDLAAVLKLIRNSRKPFIYVGGGAVISGASEEVREFAELIDAPVCDTLMGKGVFDGGSPRYTGMIGMHGTKTSNFGVSECDLLIALGARFSDRVIGSRKSFAKNAKKIHIDIDAAEINKNIRVDRPIVGDLKTVLGELNPMIEQQSHPEWMEKIAEYKERYPLKYEEGVLSCPFIMEEIDRQTSGSAVIVTDVGQHQMWAAQFYKYTEPRTFLSSGGLGTMGFGLGAAIGAKCGRPDRTVVNITGDGCFRMNMNELATASRYGIKVIDVIIDNRVLGMVRQWQTLFYEKRYSETVLDDGVDFVKVAEGLACRAFGAGTREEFGKAFKEALECDGPAVIDCRIGKDDMVLPMAAPGRPLTETMDQDDL